MARVNSMQMTFIPNRNSLPRKLRPAFRIRNCSHSQPNDSLCCFYQFSLDPQGLETAACHLWCLYVPSNP